MCKSRKSLKEEIEVLEKDRQAKADQVLSLEKKIEELEAMLQESNNNLTVAQNEALESKQSFKNQERNNAMLQQQMERKSCDGCIHIENYRKCTSCARYPKLKDKWEEKN